MSANISGKSLLWKTSGKSYQVSWGRCLCDFYGCGRDLLFVGNQRHPAVANFENQFETNVTVLSPSSSAIALQIILKPTPLCCHLVKQTHFEANVTLLSPSSSALALQSNLKTTPLCCHQIHLLKQDKFEANVTFHLLLSALTIVDQDHPVVSNFVWQSAKTCYCWQNIGNIFQVRKLWALFFVNIYRYKKSCLQCMMTLPS